MGKHSITVSSQKNYPIYFCGFQNALKILLRLSGGQHCPGTPDERGKSKVNLGVSVSLCFSTMFSAFVAHWNFAQPYMKKPDILASVSATAPLVRTVLRLQDTCSAYGLEPAPVLYTWTGYGTLRVEVWDCIFQVRGTSWQCHHLCQHHHFKFCVSLHTKMPCF